MFDNEKKALVAMAGKAGVYLLPNMANRHGLITGATGTGKTVTLQTMAETFSQMGVPVFAADIKGDLSGIAATGGNKESVVKRVDEYGLKARGFAFQAFPAQFWDVLGEQGAPVRATIADMGPLLISRLLQLNETQSAVLAVVFKLAREENLELVDLKDLKKLLEYVSANAQSLSAAYGNMATATIGAIQRGLVALEEAGAGVFFGEPSLNIQDLMQTVEGQGVINVLAADKLMSSPKVYTTFLLWLMNALFDVMPEVGDMNKPKLVFFFDEAHLLFSDAPKALLEKIEQVVKLIRSKGVGIYFITQSPADIPDSVLAQLGNRVQHALRAYTPADQKALKAAAKSFRANPAFDTEETISVLGTGEALVSFLDAKGAPQPVERAFILPPQSQIGPLDAAVRDGMIKGSLVYRLYSQVHDRVSAYETLTEKQRNTLDPKEIKAREKLEEQQRKEEERQRLAAEKEEKRAAEKTKKFWSDTARSIVVPIVRQFLTSIFRGGRR